MKSKNLRSYFEFGEASECRRGLLCGMGITPEEQDRPLIGIINSWNEYNPGHVHLKALAERVKQGVREAGGYPVEVMTTGICDGMVLKDPKYVEIPSRNSIADQVEITVEGTSLTVWLCSPPATLSSPVTSWRLQDSISRRYLLRVAICLSVRFAEKKSFISMHRTRSEPPKRAEWIWMSTTNLSKTLGVCAEVAPR